MPKNQLFNPIRDKLFARCLTPADYRLPGGDRYNNRLDIAKLRSDQPLRREVTASLAELVMDHGADLILPVPDRANWLAEAVAFEAGLNFGILHPTTEGGVEYMPGVRELVEVSKSVVIMDDVLDRLEGARKVVALPGVEARLSAVVGVFDRGPLERATLDVPVESVVHRPIPAYLPADDKLWRAGRTE